jgi:hypothetical protein
MSVPGANMLADTLEVLNLSGNRLRDLLHQLTRLHKLQVLFASDNDFTLLPEALGDCPSLHMVGFKANCIAHVAAAPPAARLALVDAHRQRHRPFAHRNQPSTGIGKADAGGQPTH